MDTWEITYENLDLPFYEDADVFNPAKRSHIHFESIKQFAVYRVGSTCLQSLQILEHVVMLRVNDVNDMKLPHEVFSWRTEHLYQRLQLPILWILLLIRDVGETQLEYKKLIKDIKEIKCDVYEMIQNYSRHRRHTDFGDLVKEPLDMDEFADELSNEFDKNKFIMLETKDLFFKKDTKIHSWDREELLKKIGDLEVIEPIMERYQVGYQKGQIHQCELRINDKTDKLQKQLTHYYEQILSNNYVSEIVNDTYATQIVRLKARIDQIMAKYEKEYDAVSNQNQFIKLDIDKLHLKRTFLEEHIQRFHEEIEEWHLKDQRRQQKLKEAVEMQQLQNNLPSTSRKGKKKKGIKK